MQSTMDAEMALRMFKYRKNELPTNTAMDEWYNMRLAAALEWLEAKKGIVLCADESHPDDLLLLVDVAVWQHDNRDNPAGEPAWLANRLLDGFVATSAAKRDGVME